MIVIVCILSVQYHTIIPIYNCCVTFNCLSTWYSPQRWSLALSWLIKVSFGPSPRLSMPPLSFLLLSISISISALFPLSFETRFYGAFVHLFYLVLIWHQYLFLLDTERVGTFSSLYLL